MNQRRDELSAGLSDCRERIQAAAVAAGRDPAEVTLVVVTKTYPASDLALLAGLGVREVGESRDQEASAKHAELGSAGLTWHLIGQLQTNKARSVASYADLVHTVDRPGLVTALSAGAVRAGRELDCLLQVSLDGDPARGGVALPQLDALAEAAAQAPGLRVAGIMAVAPLGTDPKVAFEPLPHLLHRVQQVVPQAGVISAGMSGDLEAAIACGATHVRVGSAILGARSYPANQ